MSKCTYSLVILLMAMFEVSHLFPMGPRQFYLPESVLIIGHRGAPEYALENTSNSYYIAMLEKLDYVEMDICITGDGIPVCMHDIELSSTTNVATVKEFASRYKMITLNSGVVMNGWFVNDFTLAEIKTLRLKERLPGRNQGFNGIFQVSALSEILQQVQQLNQKLNISVGLYIEPKMPTYFKSIGLDQESLLFDCLAKAGYRIKGQIVDKIIIESFESTFLERIRPLVDIPLVQLINAPHVIQEDTLQPYSTMMTEQGLDLIMKYASAIGLHKGYLYPFWTSFFGYGNEFVLTGKKLISSAHDRNIMVHAWTVSNRWDDSNMRRYFETENLEYKYLYELGVDGVFSESASAAICTKEQYLKSLDGWMILCPMSNMWVVFLCNLLVLLGITLAIGFALGMINCSRKKNGEEEERLYLSQHRFKKNNKSME